MSTEIANEVAGTAMGAGASLMSLLPMIIIFVIFYFFLIRPQLRKQKQVEQMLSSLKKGDKVLAAGGLFGVIHKIEGEVVSLDIAENVRVNVAKSSINELVNGEIAKLKENSEKADTKPVSKPKAKSTAKKPSKAE